MEEIKDIQNDDDHEKAMTRVNELWDAQIETVEYEELERLVILIEAYEEKRWPMGSSSPSSVPSR